MALPGPQLKATARRWALVLFASLAISRLLSAQAPSADTLHYTNQPVCKIPFHMDQAERRVQQVQLFFSTDLGRNWKQYANAAPNKGFFEFTGERDGTYWFAVRTLDVDGQAFPAALDQLRPGLKVFIDTQPPVVTLRSLAARDESVGVEWDLRDENLSLASFRLEYRLAGGVDWKPVTVEPAATGQKTWNPGGSGGVEVRLRVLDLAKNPGEAKITVNPGGGGASVSEPVNPGKPLLHLVNSRRISLNFEVRGEGPSGISAIELWVAREGRQWQKHPDLQSKSPPFVFDVKEEGIYGFTLLAKSGVGLSEKAPQEGDAPQIWVEVDLTKPVVRLLDAKVSEAGGARMLSVSWTATDKNLGRQPIAIKYAEQPEGEWTSIVATCENSGQHLWRIPQTAPVKFYVKVEALDKAGNIGSDQTKEQIIVDLSKPKVHITGVNPANN